MRVAIYKPLNKKIAIKVYEKSKIKETQKKKVCEKGDQNIAMPKSPQHSKDS